MQWQLPRSGYIRLESARCMISWNFLGLSRGIESVLLTGKHRAPTRARTGLALGLPEYLVTPRPFQYLQAPPYATRTSQQILPRSLHRRSNTSSNRSSAGPFATARMPRHSPPQPQTRIRSPRCYRQPAETRFQGLAGPSTATLRPSPLQSCLGLIPPRPPPLSLGNHNRREIPEF